MNQLDLFATSPAEPTQAQAAQERQSWEARQAPVVVGTVADEKRRTSTHRDQILALLKQGSATNHELAEITPRYGARLHELQDEHPWEKTFVNKKTGLVVYRLKEGT